MRLMAFVLLLLHTSLFLALRPSSIYLGSSRGCCRQDEVDCSVRKTSTELCTFLKKSTAILVSSLSLTTSVAPVYATDTPIVPLYTQRTADLQKYNDIGRGFQLLRPFGFNEFDGAGAGYAVKFASLVDIDENVVVGSTPATAGKTSIADYGAVDDLAEKLAKRRNGKVISAKTRLTDNIMFYDFQFENPLDRTLPRTGSKDYRPNNEVELFELCVHKGRLWSVKATSNDKLFIKSELKLRNTLASFIPKL